MSEWNPIQTAPHDWTRPDGQRVLRLRERDGRETLGRRTISNTTGWAEAETNRELRPVAWAWNERSGSDN
jgi:hypothetical protein